VPPSSSPARDEGVLRRFPWLNEVESITVLVGPLIEHPASELRAVILLYYHMVANEESAVALTAYTPMALLSDKAGAAGNCTNYY